jgi:hypothetical protein
MGILRSRALGGFAVSSVVCVVLLLTARSAWAPTEELFGNYHFAVMRAGANEIARLAVTNRSNRRLLVRGGIEDSHGVVIAAFEPGAILPPGASLEIEAPGQGEGAQRLRLTGRVFFFGPRGGGPLAAGARPVASLEIADSGDGHTVSGQYFGDSGF